MDAHNVALCAPITVNILLRLSTSQLQGMQPHKRRERRGPGRNPSLGYSLTQKDLCQVSTTNHDHPFLSSRLVTLIVNDLFLAKLGP